MANFEELKSKSNLTWGAIFAWSVFLAWTVFYVTSSYHTLNRNDTQLESLQGKVDVTMNHIHEEMDRVEDEFAAEVLEIRNELRTLKDDIIAHHEEDIDYFNARLDRKVQDVENLVGKK